ncbi:MAG: hypothetical protein IJV65_03160 [Kiritimatiellae bacterium]|nr:hypothetical protein [Kiritimatiellia bacterium]
MSVIEELDALQQQDSAIRDLEKKVRDLPLRRRQETDRVDGVGLRLQEARDGVAAGEKNIAAIEDEIETHKAIIARWEKQRQTLRDANEYKAMNQQIDREARALHDDEARLQNARAVVEDARAGVKSMEALKDEQTKFIEDYVAQIDLELAKTQRALLAAKDARAAFVAPLDVPEKRKFLSYYERLGKKYWPVVIHLGKDEACCPGCHMKLPPSKIQEAQRNTKLEDDPAKMKTVACDYCGRLVFKK